MRTPPSLTALIPLISTLVLDAPAHSASFMGLGDLPGGAFASKATAISDDGSVVVGAGNYSATGDTVIFESGDEPTTEAFRWESSTGMVGLGFPSDPIFPGRVSNALGVSANGAVVVGVTLQGGFRWDESDGLIAFQHFSNVADVSASGEAIAANRNSSSIEAIREDGNSSIGLGSLPGHFGSVAHGISSDGAVVVGSTWFSQGRAFRWDAAGGMIDLGDLPGHADSLVARHASADGSVVVGWAAGVPLTTGGRIPHAAFRWDAQHGMTSLGFLEGGDVSKAQDVSADGSVVVGEGEIDNVRVAFIWDAEHGMRRLDDALEALGVDLTGWSLSSATGVSADGSTIVGFGNGPNGLEAWIAVVPEPGSEIPLAAGLALLCYARRRRTAIRGAGRVTS